MKTLGSQRRILSRRGVSAGHDRLVASYQPGEPGVGSDCCFEGWQSPPSTEPESRFQTVSDSLLIDSATTVPETLRAEWQGLQGSIAAAVVLAPLPASIKPPMERTESS
jgi:hypothetical protein